jgi:hypothetical protein
MSKYKWVNHNGMKLYEVGILPDGALHNPRGYPDEIVRAAVLAADQRWHEHRSKAAKKAAVTRQERQEKRVYAVAARIVQGRKFGPRNNCIICGRGLGDAQSIARGIGSECWQGVLGEIARLRAHEPCSPVSAK